RAHRHLHSFPTRRSSDLIPHFYVEAQADITALAGDAASTSLRMSRPIEEVLIGASARALRSCPQMLTSWIDGKIRRHREVNIGIDRKSTRLNSSHVSISY